MQARFIDRMTAATLPPRPVHWPYHGIGIASFSIMVSRCNLQTLHRKTCL